MLGTQTQKQTKEATEMAQESTRGAASRAVYLGYAKDAIEKLQSKWWWGWPKNRWGGINAWQSCVIADSLITYTLVSQDQSYVDVVKKAVWNNWWLSGNDDDLWSAVAALKVYVLTGDRSFYEKFVPYEYKEIVTKYWDDKTCGGGVWWDYKKTYKNAITNELWILFLTLIYAAKKEVNYLDWARKAWKWFDKSGMINKEHLINDGLTPTCENNDGPTWTYNQGVILGALANLSQWSDDSIKKDLISKAKDIACAVTDPKNGLVDNGIHKGVLYPILKEPGCLNQDRESFKGIFMRNCAYMLTASDGEKPTELVDFITKNADYVHTNRLNDGKVNAYWAGCKDSYGAAAQGSGIDLFTAAASISTS